MLDPSAPFVLLDDARDVRAAPARLYTRPAEIVVARSLEQVLPALDRLREAARDGLHAAGYLAYEAGFALEPKLAAPALAEGPLLWFGLFEAFESIASQDVPDLLPDPAGAWLGTPRPQIDRAAYDAAIAHVLALIEAGDIYQANLTYRADVAHAGHPLALYAGLRQRARAGYGGIVWTGDAWLLSCSPELLFALDDGFITARPMKGTARSAAEAAKLAEDEKQRAENLMIVDLLRHDLSRVAVPGSVAVPRLFHVEHYPTVYQMTSTVTAHLGEERDALDVLRATFPCGSITGAPKIRAMEVIDEVEGTPRGVYCGSIGRIDAGGQGAAFNVAIRTLHLRGGQASLGLGSGIVADSNAGDEWAECQAKAAFVPSSDAFDLIETIRFDPIEGLCRLDAHLARLRHAADVLGFPLDRHNLRNDLQASTFRLREPARVRVLLSRSGSAVVHVTPLPAMPLEVLVALAPHGAEREDFRLAHKTSDRRVYAAIPTGCFDVLHLDAEDWLTEGSFTSIFVRADDGALLTPSLSRGLLPGVLRAELLATGQAREADLTPADLSGGFFVGNALRGLLPARFAAL